MTAFSDRNSRRLTIGVYAGWYVGIFVAVRAVAKAHDTNPEHLLGLLPLAYLAAWGPFLLMSGHTKQGALARFLVCTFSIALCLGMFEVVTVMGGDYRPLFSTPTPPWRRPGNRPDRELLYVKDGPKQTTMEFQGAERSRLQGAGSGTVYRCELRLDRNGFRNATELSSAEIIVIGDSFVEGLQVSRQELLTDQLSGLLGKTVANLGRTSYGPQQELHVLRRYGLGLKPRACVWAFYEGNDLQDLNAYEREQDNLSRILADDRSRTRYERSFARNGLGYVIRNWIRPDRGLPARLYTGRLAGGSGEDRELYFTTGIQHGEVGPELPRGAHTPEFQRFLRILAEARSECDRHHIDLVVAFVPSKFRVYRNACRFAPNSPCLRWPVDALGQEMEQAIRRDFPGTGFVDLSPVMAGAAARGEILYLPDDTHWSPAGHRLAAEVLADRLRNRDEGRHGDRLTSRSDRDRGHAR